jgi:hypothetical protein
MAAANTMTRCVAPDLQFWPSPVVVKVFDTVSSVQVGSVEMLGNTVLVLSKKVTNVLASNDASNCVAVSVAYQN